MSKPRVVVVCGLILTGIVAVFAGPLAGMSPEPAAPVQPSDRQQFMRQKLTMVSSIMEGLTTEDFDMVKEGGRELAKLTESAAWVSGRDPFYRRYSANFEQAVQGLVEAAEADSVEKVTFAMVHVTFSCTACHQHVRNVDRVAFRNSGIH